MAWPIKLQLFLLACCALSPALGIVLYSGLTQRYMAIAAAQEQALSTVKELANSQQQVVDVSRVLLTSLSKAPEIMHLDVLGSERFLNELHEQNPIYAGLALFDASGRLVASGLPGKHFSIADMKIFTWVMHRKTFVFGDYSVSRITGNPVMHLACPVFDANRTLQGALMASFDLGQYVRYFSMAKMPLGSNLILTTHAGARFFSFPEVLDTPGALDTTEILAKMLGGGDGGVFWGMEGDKEPRLYGYKRIEKDNVEGGAIYFRVGIPKAKALAMANGLLYQNLALLGATAAFTFAMAWVVGNFFIANRLERFMNAAVGLARGDFSSRTEVRHDEGEIGELAKALDVLAHALDERERGREKAQKRLKVLIHHLKTTVQDRTKKLAEKAKELEQANLCLREVDKVKSIVLTTVSHDLRTPLTSLRGFAKLVHKDFIRYFSPLASNNEQLQGKAARIERNLDIILDEGERLTRMINDFLDLSRIESGRMQWHDVHCDLREQAQQALDRVRGEFELIPEVELVAELGTSPVPVLTDPDRLQQVFVNLLTNAAKFTSKGQVRLTVTAYATEALVCVSDTGVGIPPDRIESVFDMFHTTACPDTKNDAHRGTGLGLAICMRIVEHYGGCVWVESELAEGSRFYFNMPISQALTAELRLPLH